jgi:hypothetical protein
MIKIDEGIFPLLLKLAMPTTGTYLCTRRSFQALGMDLTLTALVMVRKYE